MPDIPHDMHKVTRQLREEAEKSGFPIFGVTHASPPPRYDSFLKWVNSGYAGTMRYLAERAEAYSHPSYVLDGCKRIVVLGMPYSKSSSEPLPNTHARVAAYASGNVDYHDLIRERLNHLQQWLVQSFSFPMKIRGVVDTAPILEREFGALAGVGWIGKNTLLLNRSHGSYFFLALLLTDLELTIDDPFQADHCGTCRACLDACPTDAFVEPRVLNASRCISYLTIEHREAIDSELAEQMQDWAFGCDVCQQVCPWNRKPIPIVDPQLDSTNRQQVDLIELLKLDEATFRKLYRSTPKWRTKWSGMMRNACIAAGNQKLVGAIPYLEKYIDHESIALREAATWAIEKLQSSN